MTLIIMGWILFVLVLIAGMILDIGARKRREDRLSFLEQRVDNLVRDARAAEARSRGVGGTGEHRGYTMEDAGRWHGYNPIPSAPPREPRR